MVALVVGFLLFHAVEKLALIHHAHEQSYADHHHTQVGVLSASALVAHSFMDGVGIGLGFQVSTDRRPGGGHGGDRPRLRGRAQHREPHARAPQHHAPLPGHARRSTRWPPSRARPPPWPSRSRPGTLVLYLGFFTGFLLYIGAADILPEAHSRRSSAVTILLTCLGAAFVYVVVSLVPEAGGSL